jgi:uncharacterized protein DUF1153
MKGSRQRKKPSVMAIRRNQLQRYRDSEAALIALGAVLSRQLACLKAELHRAKCRLEAAETERDRECARAVQLTMRLGQVERKRDANPSPPKSVTFAPRVLAPDGTPLTMDMLPGPNTKRWVPSRKAVVVSAVRVGMLSLEEACVRYGLTQEEFAMWEFQVERHGVAGLRTSKAQLYRKRLLPTTVARA